MKKLAIFSYVILFVILLCFIFISYLENGRYNNSCEKEYYSTRVVVCELIYYPTDHNKLNIIRKLIKKKENGLNPTPDELLSAVTFAPYQYMEGLNGIFCNDNIIISDKLSKEAKLFVSRHELEHAFQWAGVADYCTRGSENCAVISAATEYPSGFIETVVSSLITAYNEMPDKQCFLFSSWDVFRTYILP